MYYLLADMTKMLSTGNFKYKQGVNCPNIFI